MDRDTIERQYHEQTYATQQAVTSLVRALALLPDGVHLIAATLDAKGVRGERVNSCDCPLALYLQARCGRPVMVSTDTAAIYVYGEWHGVRLPLQVRRFVAAFDRGGATHLVGTPTAGNVGPMPQYRAMVDAS